MWGALDLNKQFENELGKLVDIGSRSASDYRNDIARFLQQHFKLDDTMLFEVSSTIVHYLFDRYDSLYIELEMISVKDLEIICKKLRGISLSGIFVAELLKRKGQISKWEIDHTSTLKMYPKSFAVKESTPSSSST